MGILKKSEELEKIAVEIYGYTNSLKMSGMSDDQMRPLVLDMIKSYHLPKRKIVQILMILKKMAGDVSE